MKRKPKKSLKGRIQSKKTYDRGPSVATSISSYSLAVATMYNNESEELDVMIKTAEKIIHARKHK